MKPIIPCVTLIFLIYFNSFLTAQDQSKKIIIQQTPNGNYNILSTDGVLQLEFNSLNTDSQEISILEQIYYDVPSVPEEENWLGKIIPVFIAIIVGVSVPLLVLYKTNKTNLNITNEQIRAQAEQTRLQSFLNYKKEWINSLIDKGCDLMNGISKMTSQINVNNIIHGKGTREDFEELTKELYNTEKSLTYLEILIADAKLFQPFKDMYKKIASELLKYDSTEKKIDYELVLTYEDKLAGLFEEIVAKERENFGIKELNNPQS